MKGQRGIMINEAPPTKSSNPRNAPEYTLKPKSGTAGECLAGTWWGAQVMGRL